ncbi:unnamed protein product [Rotaria sordida]|uniref:Uncharacterized protein n=1 Tax=Rotaria sordida TaxID=392033 RepID=A0A819HAS1_9BILA|nr:unnamed protein product [Rotaria sordida]
MYAFERLLSNQNLPSTTAKSSSQQLSDAIERFLTDDKISRLAPNKKRTINGKQRLREHMEFVHAQFKGATLIRQSALANDNVITMQIDWEQIPSLTTIKGTSMFREIIAKPNGVEFVKHKSDEQEILITASF